MTAPSTREALASQYLKGRGIEIGALQKPLPVPAGVSVIFVDRLTIEEAREEFAELGDVPLVMPDILTDAESLRAIPSGSQDFVIGNHVLEHMKNPLAAIGNWLRVLKPGGSLYAAVPDHTNPLDRYRAVTTVEHMLDDYAGIGSHDLHYYEYAASVFHDSPERIANAISYYRDRDYAIHFHTFSRESFEKFLESVCTRFPASVPQLETTDDLGFPEHIAVLQKLLL